MLKCFNYKCPECKFERKDHYVSSEGEVVVCECGGRMERQFTVSTAFPIPAYMKAAGSVGSSENSCDRQAAYLKSPRHRRDRIKDERMQDRAVAAQDGLKAHIAKELGAYDSGQKKVEVKQSA